MLNAFIGIGEESTYGTAVARTRFYELLSESVEEQIERIESAAIRSGRRTLHRRAAGVKRVTGSFELELAPQGIGVLLKHCLGSVSTTGTNPYTHTLTPGALNGKSLSIEIAREFSTGTVTSHLFEGCKIIKWGISCEVNQWAKLKLDVVGEEATISQSPSSVTYPTGWSPFTFVHGTVTTIGGTSYDLSSFSIDVDNGLQVDRFFLGANRQKEPLEAKLREIKGSLTTPYANDTLLNQLRNGTEAQLVVTFNAGASAQLTVTANVWIDGKWPHVERDAIASLPIDFTAMHSTSDASALMLTLVNSDSAP
jgi:hypothetical protein